MMWPPRRDLFESTLAAEQVVEDLYAEALLRWAPVAAEAVLPSFDAVVVTAAADELPPDPEALESTQAEWVAIAAATVLPGVAALWADAATIAAAAKPLGAIGKGVTDVLGALTDVRGDFMADYATLAAGVPATVRTELRKIILDAEPDTTRTGLRALIRQAITPGSVMLRKVSRRLGYHGASILNHATMTVAKHGGGADRKVWKSLLDEKTRDSHWVADGQVAPLDGSFTVGGVHMAFPGDPSAPAREVINCVVAETLVSWPGQDVSHVTRRRHQGTFVHLVTVDGNDLTVTANHPVLTNIGYIPAHLLRPGDYVIASDPIGSPQVDDMPARADEIYRAFRDAGMEQRVIAGKVDFHNDALEGDEISIVRSDSNLSEQIDPSLFGCGADTALMRLGGGIGNASYAGAAVDGLFDLSGTVSWTPLRGRTPSLVSSPGHSTATIDANPRRSEAVGFADCADWQVPFSQSLGDGVSANAENVRHLHHTGAIGMKPSQLFTVDVYSATHDVYNFSTTNEFYCANGIAVHNCRCRLVMLAKGEELKIRAVPAGEAEKRAERGVTREADDPIAASAGQETAMPEQETQMSEQGASVAEQVTETPEAAESAEEVYRTFANAVIAFIGVPTSDNRVLSKDIELTVRTPPLPLMWMRHTGDGSGHVEAFTVGVIEAAGIDDDQIKASGYLLNSPEADEAADQLKHGVTRPSVDLGSAQWALTDEGGEEITEEMFWDLPLNAKVFRTFTAAELIGMTLVATPAFGDTSLSLSETSEPRTLGLTAAAGYAPRIYQAHHFSDPCLDAPTLPTLDEDGRVFGHIACWGQCHRSVQTSCVLAPRSPSGYSHFHTSPAVRLDDGTRMPVGRLTVGTGHAAGNLGGVSAQAHYDNTGTCWAMVRVGEDEHGIWFSGVAAPWASPETIEAGLAAPISGDWRDFGQGLELVAALSVNTPGFAARGRDDDQGRPAMLVAALGPSPDVVERSAPTLTRDDIKAAVAEALADQSFIMERDTMLARAARVTHPKTPRELVGELLAEAGTYA